MKSFYLIPITFLLILPTRVFAQGNDKETAMETTSSAKIQAVKVDFLSPLTGNLTAGYERVIGKNVNLDVRVGIVGLGVDFGDNAFGVFIKAGPKLLIDQEFTSEGDRRKHPLGGKYVRPEVVFTFFDHDGSDFQNGVFRNTRESVTSAGIILNYGKQGVVGSRFLIDYHIGLGYAYTSNDGGWYYSHSAGPSQFPVAISFGLLLGYMF